MHQGFCKFMCFIRTSTQAITARRRVAAILITTACNSWRAGDGSLCETPFRLLHCVHSVRCGAKNLHRKIAGNIDPLPSLIEAIDPVRFSALHEGLRRLQAVPPLPGAVYA